MQAAAAHLGDAPVLVLNGDVPLVTAEALSDLIEAHAAERRAGDRRLDGARRPDGLRARRAPRRRVGRARGGDEGAKATRPPSSSPSARSTPASTPSTAPRCKDALERLTPDNAQGELYLPSTLELLDRVAAHPLDDPTLLLGVNDRADLARVRALAQARIHREHMRAGVTIVDPASTLVDVTVAIGADTVIEPSSFLRGATTIGERCAVGPLTTLIDTALGDEVRVPHSYLVECEVRAGASVGPFAYLRPGALLRERAKAGTFVEIKNSDIGEGTKVPHLSYIGDADVGPNTNLGAATITANYDGTPQAPHDDRRGRAHVGRHDPRRAGDDRRRRLRRRELRDHRGRAARRPRDRARAPDQHRGLRRAQARSARRRTHRRDPRVD